MKILEVLIQHGTTALDRTFTYLYAGQDSVDVGYRVLVRFHMQKVMGFVTRVVESMSSKEELEAGLGYELSFIEQVVDKEALLNEELLTLAEEVSQYYLAPRISVLLAMLPPSLRPTVSSLKGPKIAYDSYLELIDPSEEGLTGRQIEVLRLIRANGTILKKEAGSPTVVQKLMEAGRIRIVKKEKQRLIIPKYEREEPHALNLEQQKAYDDLLNDGKEVSLLQGVTGSGKTEVYLHLSEAYLKKGKNILMLVPEISLTPVMVEYFSRRFEGKVAILHSELTPAEKYDEYRRIASGKAQVVVGARSAVFAPLENIGLIVIDEEHVESYKQDNQPYYHAREVAIMRAKHFGAKVILGSATPSFETKARARKGVYGYAEILRRVNEKALPYTKIIDLRDRRIMMPNDRVFSKTLLDKIKERMAKKEQVMLLVNRRGYSSLVTCAHCGHSFACPQCHGNLTYHREDEMLKCHHCGYAEVYPSECPECGSSDIKRIGFGTERVVKVLLEYLPEARIARLDSDVGKVKNNVAKTLREFREGQYDILVGTQMIAKGHDFPRVTLVGVVMADAGLILPSYRASESVFELVAQAVGRSGRGSLPGEALIQTYNPQHYAITLGAKQDYEAFYHKEMQERRAAKFPPYYYLATILFSGKNEEKTAEAAFEIKQLILAQNFASVDAIGPMVPYYSMLGDYHRRTVLLRFKTFEPIKAYLNGLIHDLSGKGGVGITVDIDPLEN